MKLKSILWGLVPLVFLGCGNNGSSTDSTEIDLATITKEDLGKMIYHDASLSKNRLISCATCHSEKKAFTDKRTSSVGHASSFSADNEVLGNRNVPSLSYINYTPEFNTSIDENNITTIKGGFFRDGHAQNLKDQAGEEFVNSATMQMPNRDAVIDRIRENDNYTSAFMKLYGEDVFNDTNSSYDALVDTIALFEKTNFFSSFDSKYDDQLEDKYEFTDIEKRGYELFIDRNRANCVSCHSIENKLFTDYTYANIGLPSNKDLPDGIDYGVSQTGFILGKQYTGQFKVPSLRNVGVTAPYMHNGLFKDLKTVVHFYNTRDLKSGINPETGSLWREPEIKQNVNHSDMGALRLTDEEEDALVAFLNTLTDSKYEK